MDLLDQTFILNHVTHFQFQVQTLLHEWTFAVDLRMCRVLCLCRLVFVAQSQQLKILTHY